VQKRTAFVKLDEIWRYYGKRSGLVKKNCMVGNNNVSIIQADISNSVASGGTDLKIGRLIIQGNPPSLSSLPPGQKVSGLLLRPGGDKGEGDNSL
jgi:hypothetical protein